MQPYPKHYCGVFGIYGHPDAAKLTYYGLYALQHRGQESAGIVTCDGKRFSEHKGMGLVSQIFNGEVLDKLKGSMAVGHTRYSTTGSSHLRNAQPLTGNCRLGQVAVAHNGNLTNAMKVRDELEAQGMKNTGASNIGGSIVTAGGLVFIAATTDSKFRAFDSRTGAELWVTKLDASGTTVPMTYLGRDGRQYVVVAAGGTNRFRMIANTADKNADTLIAFALPNPHDSQVAAQARSSRPAANVSSMSTTPSSVAPAEVLPEGEGKAIVISVCTKCHGPTNFSTLRMSRTGWEDEVEDMKDRGAVGTEDDFKKIIDYLARNFPPKQ